mmetsp:Transcript_35770/g.76387  ORF Transcript_35770/g.76387 Transcript_35770/m.76387 type:complete len:233 (-) Transcript_35770:66-764(-)
MGGCDDFTAGAAAIVEAALVPAASPGPIRPSASPLLVSAALVLPLALSSDRIRSTDGPHPSAGWARWRALARWRASCDIPHRSLSLSLSLAGHFFHCRPLRSPRRRQKCSSSSARTGDRRWLRAAATRGGRQQAPSHHDHGLLRFPSASAFAATSPVSAPSSSPLGYRTPHLPSNSSSASPPVDLASMEIHPLHSPLSSGAFAFVMLPAWCSVQGGGGGGGGNGREEMAHDR